MITLRLTKGSPLTYGELDGNFTDLVGQVADVSDVVDLLELEVDDLGDELLLKQNTSEKGQINGYAGLDATGKVPAAQLPSYVDDVLEVANFAALPVTGAASILYVTLDNNRVWRWTGSVYVEISPSPGSTDSVPEGSVNLYFTQARVRTTPLTGLSVTNSAIVAADTVLAGMGKAQGQINNLGTTLVPRVGYTMTAPLALAADNTGLTGVNPINILRFTDLDTTTAANQPIGKLEFFNSDAGNAAVAAYLLAYAMGVDGGGGLTFGVAPNAGAVVEALRMTGDRDTIFTSIGVPWYTNNTAISTTSSFTYNPKTHGQVVLITQTNVITLTFAAPTNITEGTMYKFLLKAGDTSLRSYAWNAAYKFPNATTPLASGTIVNGALDVITFIGGPSNTLIYDGYTTGNI